MILGGAGKGRPSGGERKLAGSEGRGQLDVRDGHHLQAAVAVFAEQGLDLDQLAHSLEDELAAVVAAYELRMYHPIMIGLRSDGTQRASLRRGPC